MIDPKYQRFVFAFFMALLMSAVVSWVLTCLHLGDLPALGVWARNWGLAFVTAFPCVIVVTPVVQRLVRYCLKSESPSAP